MSGLIMVAQTLLCLFGQSHVVEYQQTLQEVYPGFSCTTAYVTAHLIDSLGINSTFTALRKLRASAIRCEYSCLILACINSRSVNHHPIYTYFTADANTLLDAHLWPITQYFTCFSSVTVPRPASIKNTPSAQGRWGAGEPSHPLRDIACERCNRRRNMELIGWEMAESAPDC